MSKSFNWVRKQKGRKGKMAYDGFTDEYRIVAYFKDTYPSPTTYKRRTYKTLEDAERDFPKALKQYREKPYAKHLESVSIECRQVGPWRWIGD